MIGYKTVKKTVKKNHKLLCRTTLQQMYSAKNVNMF